MKLTNTLFTLLLASAAPGAFAQSADLSVTGKIFPVACSVELGNGGIVDLGDIGSGTLSPTEMTVLKTVEMPLAVSCNTPARVAFIGIDNAVDSAIVENVYGLGRTPAGEKIGGADLRFYDIDIDGQRGYWTRSYDNGGTWSPADGTYLQPPLMQHYHLGFTAQTGAITGPDPIQQLRAKMLVIAKIAPSLQLTLTEDVAINGNATINLMYL